MNGSDKQRWKNNSNDKMETVISVHMCVNKYKNWLIYTGRYCCQYIWVFIIIRIGIVISLSIVLNNSQDEFSYIIIITVRILHP